MVTGLCRRWEAPAVVGDHWGCGRGDASQLLTFFFIEVILSKGSTKKNVRNYFPAAFDAFCAALMFLRWYTENNSSSR